LQRNPDKHAIFTVEKVIDETPTVRTLVFSDELLSQVLPGQFAMVWIPCVNELPMSIMISKEKDKAAFTVRKYGTASTALYNTKVGDYIGTRGPYGNSFSIRGGNILIVGGGTGLVPLMRLLTFLKETDKVTVLMGAKTKDEVLFEKLSKQLLEKNQHNVIVTTDDGTCGQKGLVTDVVEEYFSKTKFDAVYTCGPEKMMYKVVKLATSHEIPVQASLERMMKCGIGMCGSCCIGQDLVCRDGTVFDGEKLMLNKEFGQEYRNKAGILEKY